ERTSETLLERSLHARQRMAQVHKKAQTYGPALDGQRRGNLVPAPDRPPRSRKSGYGAALALSRRFRMAADRIGLRRDAVCRAGMAPPDSVLMADRAGRRARHAQLPDASHRRNARKI